MKTNLQKVAALILPALAVGMPTNSGCAAAEVFDPGGFSVEISRAPLGKRAAEEKNVTIRAFPHAFIDDRFVLSQDQPALLLLGFNNRESVKIGKLTAIIELPETIELLGIGGGHKAIETKPGGVVRYAIDATRAREEFGWKPTHDLQQGVAATVRWYLDHRDWCAAVQSGSYRRERLGLGTG